MARLDRPEWKPGSLPHKEPIPIEEAARIAMHFGYDQVVIYARKVDTDTVSGGEHMTTYGRSKEHCSVAARMGAHLQKLMGWKT